MGRRKDTLLLLAFLAIGLILRLNNLSGRSLWTDEFFTLFQSSGHGTDVKLLLEELSHKQHPQLLRAGELKALFNFNPLKSIKDVNSSLFNTDTHPPLYFWIIYYWRMLFRDSVFALRFFSVLMGIVSIFLAYRVTYYLFNRDAAKFGALFVSIAAFSVRYSQEARSYSLVMALGLLTWLFILRFEEYNKGRDAFCFAVFNALGLYAHYFYVFISVAQFAYFTAAHHRESPLLGRFYLAFLCSLLFFSPWFIPVILKGYNFYLADWIFGYPGIANKLYYLFSGITRYLWMFDVYLFLLSFSLFIGFLLFIYVLTYILGDIMKKYPRPFLFCLIMFIVPILGMLFIDIIQHGALLKQERFWMFPFVGFIPFAAYALNYGYARMKIATGIVVLLMLISSVTISGAQFGPAPKYISTWINKASSGEPAAVIVYNIRSVVFAQSYYLNDSIYLIPVSDRQELRLALEAASARAARIFVVRHYHRSDASLMNQPFMEAFDRRMNLKLLAAISRDGIAVSEYSNEDYIR